MMPIDFNIIQYFKHIIFNLQVLGSDSCKEMALSVYKKPKLTNQKNKISDIY